MHIKIMIIVLALMGIAVTAFADTHGPLTVHLSDEDDSAKEEQGYEFKPGWWLAPSVAVDMLRVPLTGSEPAEFGLIPGLGYGVKWKPAGWDLTHFVLTLDLFLKVTTVIDDQKNIKGALIQTTLSFTLLNWVEVGFGLDYNTWTKRSTPILALGLSKTL